MTKIFSRLIKTIALNAVLLSACLASAQTVSTSSLLDEMLDRNAVTQVPNYVCRQASSYDRAAKSPDENWFANADASQFIRVEQNGDREESVLMEAQGPGAIVRWWITAPHYKNNFYVYIDGATEPTISGNVADVVGGEQLCGAPLSAERARGRNLYLPIPYAKSIKVTCDNMKEQGNLYYQIDYRTYSNDTTVESFTKETYLTLKDKISATNKALLNPEISAKTGEVQGYKRHIDSETMEGLVDAFKVKGPGAIAEIAVKLSAENIPAATRNVAISISFDGEETVWAPIGEFFGSGVGINPYKSWYTEVSKDGVMKAYWRMPYQKEACVSFINYGSSDVDVDCEVYYVKTPWTERSMYFHANWRQERGVETIGGNGTKDWNYTAISGTGVYVGDVLSVVNPVSAWWGEGDEKIYVDGETFPSHFGTGTEDYYGYAWCTPSFFEDPFHAQPRCQGPANFGNTTNLRFRSLDGVSFTDSLRFDMEVWHWEATIVDYAVATFWYGLPGAKIVEGVGPSRSELEDEAAKPVDYNLKFSYKFDSFEVTGDAPAGSISVQDMKGFENDGKFAWKNSKQLWWRDGKTGDKLILKVNSVPADKTTMILGCTVAKDYGRAQIYWNGEKVGEPLNFYNSDAVERREIRIAVPKTAGENGELTVELLEKDPRSIGTMFGLDSLSWE